MFLAIMLKPSGSAHKRLGEDIVVPGVAAVSVTLENVSRGVHGGGEKSPASEQFAVAEDHTKVRESSMPPEIDGPFVFVSEIPAPVVAKETSLPTAQFLVREMLNADSIEPADSPPTIEESLYTQEDLIKDSAQPILKENAWMDDDMKEQKHDVLEKTNGSPEMSNFPDSAVAVEENDSARVDASKSLTIVSVAEEKYGDGKVESLSVEGAGIPVFVSEIPVVADDSAVPAEVTARVEESPDDFVKDAGVYSEAKQGVAKGRMATDMPYSGESKICRDVFTKNCPYLFHGSR